ncbi:MAG: endonuclease III [Planctomycetota bacterium]
MKTPAMVSVLKTLAVLYHGWQEPAVTAIARRHNPFHVLISTIISQRTKDEVTAEASKRLFAVAAKPAAMGKLPADRIAQVIYPAGFYRTKAAAIREACLDIMERFEGKVPDTLDELMSLRGVGRKTANLVITLGFAKPGICVDTHVHRISNRLGYVRTRTPEETEFALRKKLPGPWWVPINDLLVSFGQNLCRPIGPKCPVCPVARWCARVGVRARKGRNKA